MHVTVMWTLGLAVALASAGCFTKPDAPNPTPLTDDASVEPGPDAGRDASVPCLMRDDFETNNGAAKETACGTWAMYKGSGTHNLTRNMGRLLAYTSTSGASVGCTGTVEVPFSAVVVQIASIPNVQDARTGVQLKFDNSLVFSLDIQSTSATTGNVYTIIGSDTPEFLVPYADSMQYFRFARRGPAGLDVSYSADGATWPSSHAFELTTPLQTVNVSLSVNFGPNVTSYTSATFDNLDACAQ